MPDFEIRYFRADGSLALVHMTYHDSESEARDHAHRHQQDHARFEIRATDGAPQQRC
jgi:hypothetical protein